MAYTFRTAGIVDDNELDVVREEQYYTRWKHPCDTRKG